MKEKWPALFKDMNFFVGLFVLLGFWFFWLSYPAYLANDSIQYLTGARFISRGLGYVIYGGSPHQLIPQVNSPPFFSFLLSCAMKMAKTDEINAFRIVNLLSLVLYYCSYYKLIIRVFDNKFFRVLANFFVINSPIVWCYTNFVLTEILFSGLLALSLVICLEALSCEAKAKRRALFLAGGLAVMFLCLTRYAGIYIALALNAAFLFIRNPFNWKQKLIEWTYLTVPPAIGLAGWFIRNAYANTYLYYLHSRHKEPVLGNLFVLERRFLDTVIGVLMRGFPISDLSNHYLRFLMGVLFFVFSFIFLRMVINNRRTIFSNKKQSYFLILVLQVSIVYIMANNLTWIARGFGITTRVFYVLFPSVFMAIALVIQQAWHNRAVSRTKGGVLSVIALLGILIFSSLCHAIAGRNYCLSVLNEMRRGIGNDAEIYVPLFKNAQWIIQFVRDSLREEVILLSNVQLNLSYLADRGCGPVSVLGEEKTKILGWSGAGTDGRKTDMPKVIVIWQKNFKTSLMNLDDLKKYLERYDYRIVRQDHDAMAIELVLSYP